MHSKEYLAVSFLLTSAILNATGLPSEETTPWLPTSINVTIFNNFLSRGYYKTVFLASVQCSKSRLCKLFCKDSDGRFSFWKIIADPFLVESEPDAVKECWTNQLRGNAILNPETVLFSPNRVYRERKVDNLKTGIYNGDHETSTHLKGYPYIQVELEKAQHIRKINLYPGHYYEDLLFRFANISVYASQTTMDGNISQYRQIGYVKGPFAVEGSYYSLKLPTPISGRYIIFKTFSSDLQIGHIQIYTLP